MTLVDSSANVQANDYIYRLAGVPGGAQTVTATLTSAKLCNGNSISVTGVTSVGTAQKTSGAYISAGSTASQSVSCAAKQLILQSFAETRFSADLPYAVTGGTSDYAFGAGNNDPALSISHATATTTFTTKISRSTFPWAAIAVVLS